MLWTIVVILVILWLLGFIGNMGGGLIHLLLVIAVIVVLVNVIRGAERYDPGRARTPVRGPAALSLRPGSCQYRLRA
jgi:hypothetical protein